MPIRKIHFAHIHLSQTQKKIRKQHLRHLLLRLAVLWTNLRACQKIKVTLYYAIVNGFPVCTQWIFHVMLCTNIAPLQLLIGTTDTGNEDDTETSSSVTPPAGNVQPTLGIRCSTRLSTFLSHTILRTVDILIWQCMHLITLLPVTTHTYCRI